MDPAKDDARYVDLRPISPSNFLFRNDFLPLPRSESPFKLAVRCFPRGDSFSFRSFGCIQVYIPLGLSEPPSEDTTVFQIVESMFSVRLILALSVCLDKIKCTLFSLFQMDFPVRSFFPKRILDLANPPRPPPLPAAPPPPPPPPPFFLYLDGVKIWTNVLPVNVLHDPLFSLCCSTLLSVSMKRTLFR